MNYTDDNSMEVDFGSLLDDPEFADAFEDASVRSALAETLRQIRKTSGQTQRQAASTMGTTQSAISELERGEADPQLSTVQRYARAVGAKVRFAVDTPDRVTSLVSPYRQVSATTSPRNPAHSDIPRPNFTYKQIKVV